MKSIRRIIFLTWLLPVLTAHGQIPAQPNATATGEPPKLAKMLSINIVDRPTFIPAVGPTVLTKTVSLSASASAPDLAGTLAITVYNAATKAVVFQQSAPVTIGQTGRLTVPFSATIRQAGSYWTTYSFRTPTDSITRSTLVGYAAAPHTNEHLTEPVVAEKIPGKALPFALENVRFSGFLEDRVNG